MTAHTRFLIALAELYRIEAQVVENRRLARSTVSHRIFRGQNDKLDKLIAGGDVKTGLFQAAVGWLDANWPPGRPKPIVLQSAANAPDAWAMLAEATLGGGSPYEVAPVEAAHHDEAWPAMSERALRMRDMAEAGHSIAEAASILGVSYTAVRNTALRHGFRFRAVKSPKTVDPPIRWKPIGEVAEKVLAEAIEKRARAK